MSISDFLFGGVDDSAQEGQQQQNRASSQFAGEQAQLAREDILNLFGPSQQNLQTGAQASIDFAQQSTPRRLDIMQQGSSRGRQARLAGLDQIQNAILGMPVDMASLQQFGNQLTPQQQAPVTAPEMIFANDVQLSQGGTNDPFTNNQQRAAQNSDGMTNKTDFNTSGTDWGEYISRQGNEDLANAFNSQSWTSSPQEWAERLWTGNAADVNDTRFYRDFGSNS